MQGNHVIKSGPLRGWAFSGGIAQMLGIYEISIQKAILSRLQLGDVFYDVGANNGFFTALASSCVGPKGTVFSFEPFPENAESIRRLIQENGLKNVRLVENAVSFQSGEADLYFGESIATPSIAAAYHGHDTFIRVPTISLDEFVASNLRPDIVKLDVEGAEVSALQGARELVSGDQAPAWIIEVHKKEDETTVLALLAEGDYSIEKLAKPGRQEQQYPVHVLAVPH